MKTNILETCPRCNAKWVECKAYSGATSEFWKKCGNPKCNTYLNTYMPQAHQALFHLDSHRFSGNFGGFGSGKSLTSREEIYKHIFITPKGNGLIGANVTSQYEQTIKREIENDIPAAFIDKVSLQKSYIDFANGYRLMFRPLDDVDKLRSYNLDFFLILEASEVKQEAFTQLKTRLRNKAAMLQAVDKEGKPLWRMANNGAKLPVIKTNWLKGIVESNPDAGWIKNDVLLKSSHLQINGDILEDYSILEHEKDPMISTHITATTANEFLPADFVEQNTKNKPAYWVARYIYGSFMYTEGAVYPSARKSFIDPYDIPPTWKRLVAFDYGLADPARFVFAALNPKENEVVIYKEVSATNKNVEELARLYFEAAADIPSGQLWCPPIIDPKSAPKRDYEKRSLSDHFLEQGIAFMPGQISVDARVFRLNTYFESGRLKIFNTCEILCKELSEYKFQHDEAAHSGYSSKPVDKNNHSINALEWIVMELPADPSNLLLGVYNKKGDDITLKSDEEKVAFYGLSDYDYYNPEHELMEETPFDIDLY